jgi:branched-chain amino acid transport system permease protein
MTSNAHGAAGMNTPLVDDRARRRVRLNSDLAQLVVGCILVVVSGFVPDLLGNAYWTHSFQLVNLFIAVAVFQNLLMHDAGQTSFGQGAIFGVAAYMSAIAIGIHGFGFPLAVLCGIGAAVLAGLLFAFPALRVQGYYLGFVTMSAATVFPEMMIAFNQYTNGVNGISLNFAGWHRRGALGISPLTFAVALVACLALTTHVSIRRTAFGRRLRVAAESSEAAQSLGISPGMMRSLAFIIVSLGTGVAGVLYPPIVGFVSPAAFTLDLSILFFFAVIVGGRGQVLGTVVGVWILYLLPNILLADLMNYRLLAYGAVAMLVMLAFPDGLIGAFERWRQRRDASDERLDIRVEGLLGERPPVSPVLSGTGEVVIDVRDATKTFGSVAALDGIGLQVKRHHIHGLVGANGSGKTSLLNILSGFSRLSAGHVTIQGVDITRQSAHHIARLGVGRTFQKPRIFSAMSLWENVLIGLDAARAIGRGGAARSGPPSASIAAMCAAMDERSVERVPHGQRRLVEVTRVVLMGADILFLDEPAAGLSPTEREQFKTLLLRLRDELGKTIVLVEHDLDLVWGIADTITVLEAGKVVAHGTTDEIAGNPSVRKLFIEPIHA